MLEITSIYSGLKASKEATHLLRVVFRNISHITNSDLKSSISLKAGELLTQIRMLPKTSSKSEKTTPEIDLESILARIKKIPNPTFRYQKLLKVIKSYQQKQEIATVKRLLEEALVAAEAIFASSNGCLKFLEISKFYEDLGEFKEAFAAARKSMQHVCDIRDPEPHSSTVKQIRERMQEIQKKQDLLSSVS